MPNILVLGERFIDRYHIGTSTSHSAEVDIPVVKIERTLDLPGGAGNVAANLRALGANVLHMYPPGHWPVKNRLMVGDTQLARWDVDDSVDPYTETILNGISCRNGGLKWFDGVVISDYCKGAITNETITWIDRHFPKIPLFIDTKRDPNLFPDRATFFPNRKEYFQYPKHYDRLNVVFKDSERGLHYNKAGKVIVGCPALARNVVSPNGAGDSVLSAWVYKCLVPGDRPDTIEDIVRFTSIAAAIAVSKPYTSTVTLKEIEDFDHTT